MTYMFQVLSWFNADTSVLSTDCDIIIIIDFSVFSYLRLKINQKRINPVQQSESCQMEANRTPWTVEYSPQGWCPASPHCAAAVSPFLRS